ncbi:MAG: hypothetical protein J1F32_05775, partial [Erysipelotrichales bacterium]|nr:hypothetical protein [Erysipelotrichales bacterium]
MKKFKLKHIISVGIFSFLALSVASVIKSLVDVDGDSKFAWDYPRLTQVVHAEGNAGTYMTWDFNSETGVLTINGSGDMTTYSQGAAPWYDYRGYIKSIIVADTIDSISANAFYGCNNLEYIKLPFIGESRTATAYEGTFGYIFGYTTIDAKNSYSGYYVFDATTEKYLGSGYKYLASKQSNSFVD